MELTNAIIDWGEEPIKLDACFLISGKDMLMTDYLLVYRANDRYGCLGIDKEDVGEGTITTPCFEGGKYTITFEDCIEGNHEEDNISSVMMTRYLAGVPKKEKDPWVVQGMIMDTVCRMQYTPM